MEVHEQEVKDDVRLCENATSLLLQAVAEAERVKPNPYIGLVAMMTMAASYSVSFGPLGWLITSEMFSTGVRGRAIGVVTVRARSPVLSAIYPWAVHLALWSRTVDRNIVCNGGHVA